MCACVHVCTCARVHVHAWPCLRRLGPAALLGGHVHVCMCAHVHVHAWPCLRRLGPAALLGGHELRGQAGDVLLAVLLQDRRELCKDICGEG